jgi:hypothetical protein
LRTDDFGPFLGFIADELAELDRRHRHWCTSQFGKARAFNDASARAAFISLFSFSMMSVGMFFGAPTPYQTLPS